MTLSIKNIAPFVMVIPIIAFKLRVKALGNTWQLPIAKLATIMDNKINTLTDNMKKPYDIRFFHIQHLYSNELVGKIMKKQLIAFATICSLCIPQTTAYATTTLEQQNAAYNKLSVTNKSISVDVVDKKSLDVLRSFTLKANRVVEIKKDIPKLSGKQIIIKKKTQPTGTIFVTQEKKYTYSNKTKSMPAAQRNRFDRFEKKWNKTLTTNQRKSLKDYTRSGYVDINRTLRGLQPTSPKIDNRIKAIDHALLKFKSPYDFTVWRGTELKNFKYGLKNGKLAIGASYSDKGYLSTSLVRAGTIGFGYDALIRIQTPAGNYGAPVYKLSPYENEEEYLLKRGTKFVVTGIKKEKHRTVITINTILTP